MIWKISFIRKAEKELNALSKNNRERVNDALNKLAYGGPYNRRDLDIKHLHGLDNQWRLRVGDCRIIFKIHKAEIMIVIIKIAPRGDVYK